MREYCEEELLVWVFPNHKCQKSCQISKTHFTLCDNLTFLFWKLHHVVVKCEHEFYCNFVKCEHGFLFYSFDIIVVFNNVNTVRSEMWVCVFPNHSCQKFLTKHLSLTRDLTRFLSFVIWKTPYSHFLLTVFSHYYLPLPVLGSYWGPWYLFFVRNYDFDSTNMWSRFLVEWTN